MKRLLLAGLALGACRPSGPTEHYGFIARLGREGQSFAVATVVGRRAPVSSHLGDHALIFANGQPFEILGTAEGKTVPMPAGATSADLRAAQSAFLDHLVDVARTE